MNISTMDFDRASENIREAQSLSELEKALDELKEYSDRLAEVALLGQRVVQEGQDRFIQLATQLCKP